MNGDRPDDGDEDKRDVKPFGGLSATIAAIEQIAADVDVQKEVAVEDDDVPTEHGSGEIELADSGDEVPEAIRPAKINRYEKEAHDNCGYREQFTEDNEVVKFFVFVNVHRDDHHDGGGGDAYQKSEIRDVNAPGNFVAHAGDDKAVSELFAVGVQTKQAKEGEDAHPGVVTPVAVEGQA